MAPASVKHTTVELWEGNNEENKPHGKTTEAMKYLYKGMNNKQCNLMDMKPLYKYTDAPLFEAYYPFFLGMKLCGLFHSKEYIMNLQQRKWLQKSGYGGDCIRGVPPLRKRITPSSVYCFVIMLMLWANVLRMIYAFTDDNDAIPSVMMKITMMSYVGLAAFNSTACFLATHKYSNIPEFFYEWGRMHKLFPGKALNYYTLSMDIIDFSIVGKFNL